MLKAISLSLCLMLPGAAFADEVAATSPAADQPTAAALTPEQAPDAATAPAVDDAKRCGMHGGCAGGRGRGKWLVLTGVAGTVLTAVAIGVAVGVATSNKQNPVTP